MNAQAMFRPMFAAPIASMVPRLVGARVASVAIFDPQVPDWEVLRAGLLPEVASVVLDPGRDGIEQLTEILTARRWETVSVFGHGAPGRMQLGAGALDGESLSEAAPEVATWQVEALRLYGCEVGAGAAGRDLVARLHRLTGAAVAAATGVLGAAGWELDVGAVGCVLPIAPTVAASYRGMLLPPPPVNRADDDTDGTDGKTTLREAIAAASAGDTITFDPSVFSAEATEIALGGDLDLTKDVTIQGDVDGDGDGDVTLKGKTVSINNGVTANLSGLTITGSTSRGMYNNGTATITNVIFSENSFGGGAGGGMYNNGTAVITNVIFSENSAGAGGGGMYNNGTATNGTATLTNVIFSENSAGGGGGMYNYGTATLTNVIFSENSSVRVGGGMLNNGGADATLTNAIFWDNTAGGGSQIGGTVTISKSIVEGGYSGGTDILTANPQFVDAANGDFHLQAGSPAIDAGDNSAVPTGVTKDLEGNNRIQGTAVDLGVYETTSAPANAAPTATDVTFSGTARWGQTLTGSYTYSDTEGDAQGTSTFQWYRANDASGTGKTAISGATSKTYTAVAADVGKYLIFSVTPVATAGTLTGSAIDSAASVIAAAKVSIAAGTPPTEADTTAGSYTLTLEESAPAGGLVLSYSIDGSSTATDPADYSLANGTNGTLDTKNGTVTIAGGAKSAAIVLNPVDDALSEPGGETVTLKLDAAAAGSGFAISANNSATLTIADNDSPGVTISKTTLAVTEGGSTDTYTVKLNTQPTHSVTVSFTPDAQLDLGAGASTAQTLTFSTTDWNSAQTVTATAIDDDDNEGSHASTIAVSATSSDTDYNTLTLSSLTAQITDNDAPTGSGGSGGTSPLPANPAASPTLAEPLANFAQAGGGGVPDGQIQPVSFAPSGEGATRLFQIFNNGNADLELLEVTLPPGFQWVDLSRRTIPPRQAALLEVTFASDTPGLHSGNVIVKTNVPGQPYYNFPVEALQPDITLPTRDSATAQLSQPTLINGSLSADAILGGPGSQVLSGLGGNDALNGNQGEDVVDGGDGDDTLNGGQGDDVLLGGAGNDILAGDLGSDALIGGDGADIFVLGETKGIDTIYDFTAGVDRIALEPTLTFGDLTLTPLDGNLQLFAGAKQLAIALNTTTLTATDFATL